MSATGTVLLIVAILWALPLVVLAGAYVRIWRDEKRLMRHEALVRAGSTVVGCAGTARPAGVGRAGAAGTAARAARRAGTAGEIILTISEHTLEGAFGHVTLPVYDAGGAYYVEHRTLPLN